MKLYKKVEFNFSLQFSQKKVKKINSFYEIACKSGFIVLL